MNLYDAHTKEIFNKILKEFSCATGLATVMVDIHGEQISNWYHFTNFCQLMRSKPELKKYCEKCDLYGGLEASKETTPIPYTCHAGLTDLAMPIIINGQIAGFILSGQVLTTGSSFPPIYKKSNWKEHADLKQAFKHLKKVSKEQITSAAEILRILVEHYFPSTSEQHSIGIKEPLEEHESISPLLDEEKTSSNSINITIHNVNQKVDPTKVLHPEIAKAIRFIDKQLTTNLTLKQVADHVFLNPDYFSKLFKKQTGLTFIHYVNNKKIERSLYMLRDIKRPIEKISEELGYSQTSYYCKLFKKTTGYSPSEYRKIIQNKNIPDTN